MPTTFSDFAILGGAYLFGSIPFGLLFSWLFQLQDPRAIGSKNIGATNILRTGHKRAAALTFLFDALKGTVAVAFALVLNPELAQWAGFMAVVGHRWPVWLYFHGGKGVATSFGVILTLSWPIGIACLVTWIVIAITIRYSSLAALVSTCLSPFYSIILKREDLVIMCLGLGFLIFLAHRQNIGRLITGKERKIGDNNTPPSPHV